MRIKRPSRQFLITVGALALASGAMALAIIYSGDQEPGFGANSPIEGWFPTTGEGGACAEKVGVDLIPGFAAKLIINGVAIPDEETNFFVRRDPNNPDSTVLTSDGANDKYTWGPDKGCPNAELLRTGPNTVVACVYKIGTNPINCTNFTYSFEVL